MNRLAEVTNVTMPKGTVGGTPMMGDGPKGKGKEKKVKKVKVKKVKKEKKGAFSSPSLMRKAEALSSGKHADIGMLEASVRAVEGGVLSSSELDKQVQVRVSELTMDTSAAVGNSTEAVERLNTLSQKFKDLRASASKAFLAKHKTPFHDASMLEARLVVRAAKTLTDSDRRALQSSSNDCKEILRNLIKLGEQRNHILDHCLNGLANAKVSHVLGEMQNPQVFEHLYTLMQESEVLKVPHDNARVRLKHSLGICDRLMGGGVKVADINEFERLIETLRIAKESEGSGRGGGEDDAPPPLPAEDAPAAAAVAPAVVAVAAAAPAVVAAADGGGEELD